MTFTFKLRDAARQCSNVDYRDLLKKLADEVQKAIDALHTYPTEENMRTLIGVWAKAERVFDEMPPEGTPSPLSGSPEPARLAA